MTTSRFLSAGIASPGFDSGRRLDARSSLPNVGHACAAVHLACADGGISPPRAHRRRHALALAAAIVGVGGTSPITAQTYYNAVQVPQLLPGRYFLGDGYTWGTSVNDLGIVVGNSQHGAALAWSAEAGLHRLVWDGQVRSVANSGQAVGWLSTPDGPVPASWLLGAVPGQLRTGTYLLGDLYPGVPAFGYAHAINNQGWVLMTGLDGTNNYQGALLLRPELPAVDLAGPYRPGNFGGQRTISDSGIVVGSNQIGERYQPYTWSELAGQRYYSVIPGGDAWAAGVNSAGWVVGRSNFNQADASFSVGYLYDATTDGLRATWTDFFPNAINDVGQVVGNYRNSSQNYAAGLWSASGGFRDLNVNTYGLGNYVINQAWDINESGQILVSGGYSHTAPPPTDPRTPGLATFLLTECLRCGQIRPYPVIVDTVFTVGADWRDAFNAVVIENQGTLDIRTFVNNREGAALINHGQLWLSGGVAGHLANYGTLVNTAQGSIVSTGFLRNAHGGILRNAGSILLADGHELSYNSGTWEQTRGSFEMRAGEFLNLDGGHFTLRGGTFSQTGGRFSNGEGAGFSALGGVVVHASELMNRGLMQFGGGNAQFTSVEIDGRLRNEATLLSVNTLLTVRNGSYGNDNGQAFLRAGSRWFIDEAASFTVNGGEVRLENGSSLMLRSSSDGLLGNGGRLVLDTGSTLNASSVVRSLAGFTLQNRGLIRLDAEWANAGGHIDNQLSGSFLLRSGSLLLNDGGTVTISQGSEIGGPGGFTQTAGLSVINGRLASAHNEFLGGEIRGDGVISGRSTIGAGVGSDPPVGIGAGNSPGTLRFEGETDFVNVRIDLELASHRSFDRIVVVGPLTIGQVTVALKPYGAYVPDLNDSFAWFSASQVSGNGMNFDATAMPTGWTAQPGGDGKTLYLWNEAAVALAPNFNLQGQVRQVAAGDLAYLNRFSSFINVGRVEVAGALAIRPDASFLQNAGAAELLVLGGGRLSNRGAIFGRDGRIDNAGTLLNYADGSITSGNFSNRGRFENDGEFWNSGRLVNEAGGVVVNFGTLTNPGGATLENRGRFENHGQVVNDGLIVNVVGGEFIVAAGGDVGPSPWGSGLDRYVSGGLTQVDGRLAAASIGLFGGTLQGHGVLVGAVRMSALEVQLDAGGPLTIEGSLTGDANFSVSLDGPASFGRLVVDGSVAGLNGYVRFWLSEGGYTPQAGDSFQWLVHGGTASLAGNFGYDILVRAEGYDYRWNVPDDLRVSFNGDSLIFQPVPEPQTWLLMFAGMVLISWLKRRPRGSVASVKACKPA